MSGYYETRDQLAVALKVAGDANSLAQHGSPFWRNTASLILSDSDVLDAICEFRAWQLDAERSNANV